MGLRHAVFLSLLVLPGLSACDREATGQVAAIVNGEEITIQEVNAELAALQLPEGADQEAVRRQALERIVERRLMAQVARDDGLDSSQDYLIRERQLRDSLLVQLLGERVERTTTPPDQQEVDQYIADNPGVFADRKVFTIDRIQFPAPADMEVLSPLENDHSMVAVAARLSGMRIEFQRDEARIDSAAIGPERLEQLLALPEGEPFVVPESGVVTIGVITGEQIIPLTGEEARPLALRAMRARQLNETLQQRLDQSRAAAEIEYQPDFAPAGGNDTEADEGE